MDLTMDPQLRAKIRRLYKNKTQSGSMRGIRPFYRILLHQKKIPSTTSWANFQKVFANWPIWRKFTETRKPRHKIWQHYASFNIDAEYAIDVALMAKNYKKFVGILIAINVCTRLVSAEPIKKGLGMN